MNTKSLIFSNGGVLMWGKLLCITVNDNSNNEIVTINVNENEITTKNHKLRV